ncbi:hypothetical protein D9757_001046 [Collybiopsis confluens]|uniref:BAH domain-containing protein n=1 Tax=Collybiopsis confluens TaxID=2823264 RepID=A0A8H5I0V4_9AGAR|nr:hypothetical protein D9757_001046 [Collybiopsis confluens]
MARRKQRTTAGQVGTSPDPPTSAQWATMTPWKKFTITEAGEDDEETVYVFEVGDCVAVLPPDLPSGYGVEDEPAPPLQLMWVAIVKDIRTGNTNVNNGVLDAWAQVQWFYSKKDIAKLLPKFETSHLSVHERILSDEYDFIHYTTIDAVVPVKRFIFDPTYISDDEASKSSSSDTALCLTFHQRQIESGRFIADDSPDVFYRYDLEAKKKQIFPKISQFNCFSAKAANLYHDLSILSASSKSKKQAGQNSSVDPANHNSCFSESLYCPPGSERALKIGREVSRILQEAGDLLENQVVMISEILAGRSGIAPESLSSSPRPTPSKTRSFARSKTENPITRSGSAKLSSSTSTVTPTARTRSRILRVKAPIPDPSISLRSPSSSLNKRPRTGIVKSASQIEVDAFIKTTSQLLLDKLKKAIYLEDTLSMHVCPRAECTAPCGRAWHRSCLIRDEGDVSDEDDGTDDVNGHETLKKFEGWFALDKTARPRTRSGGNYLAPTYQQIRTRWERMDEFEKMDVVRMLELLSTVPPGYSRDSSVHSGQYEFPVFARLNTVQGAGETDAPSVSANGRGKGKRKGRTSEREELEIMESLMDLDPPASASAPSSDQQKRGGGKGKGRAQTQTRSQSRARKEINPDEEEEENESPRKRRRSLRLSGRRATDSMDVDNEEGAGISGKGDTTDVDVENEGDEDEDLLKIMHCLAQLKAPEFVCLASQPMIRGGVPPLPASSAFSFSDSLLSIAGSTPVLNSDPPFGSVVQTTITGNISLVSWARIRLYSVLDGMLQKLQKTEGTSMQADADVLAIPEEWTNYVVELEGRGWLFECLYDSSNVNGASPSQSNGSGTRSKSRGNRSMNGESPSFSSSKEMIRQKILGRTYRLLGNWQSHRRKSLTCPSCYTKI